MHIFLICLFGCLVASGCTPERNIDATGNASRYSQSNSPIVDKEVDDAIEAHGFATVHVRVIPSLILAGEDDYTPAALGEALSEFLPADSWELIDTIEGQPEFLGYLNAEGLRVLRETGVAEFISRGDRVDGASN
ncbi:MAG: hypothetical protein V4692_01135 [Bdellovibrionota bacterium]